MAFIEFFTEILRFFNNIFITPKHQVRKIVKIYDTMHKVIEETPVERLLIFKAHNGGGIIKPNTPVYSSVLYENYTHPFKPVKDEYQKLESDQEYLRFLVELINNKSVVLKTEELKEGLLKNIYESEGVKYSEAYFLGNDRKNIYYCSFATSNSDGWTSSHAKSIVYIAVNTLKQNIK